VYKVRLFGYFLHKAGKMADIPTNSINLYILKTSFLKHGSAAFVKKANKERY